MDYIKLAKACGFEQVAMMPVKDLVIVPEYREYCEMNFCGNYDVVPACPPKCGTIEEMVAKMQAFERAIIIQSTHDVKDVMDREENTKEEIKHNKQVEVVTDLMKKDGVENMLVMSAGPWKKHSCLSAYCIDAQKMAEYVGMECWVNDGKSRFFSLILF